MSQQRFPCGWVACAVLLLVHTGCGGDNAERSVEVRFTIPSDDIQGEWYWVENEAQLSGTGVLGDQFLSKITASLSAVEQGFPSVSHRWHQDQSGVITAFAGGPARLVTRGLGEGQQDCSPPQHLWNMYVVRLVGEHLLRLRNQGDQVHQRALLRWLKCQKITEARFSTDSVAGRRFRAPESLPCRVPQKFLGENYLVPSPAAGSSGASWPLFHVPALVDGAQPTGVEFSITLSGLIGSGAWPNYGSPPVLFIASYEDGPDLNRAPRFIRRLARPEDPNRRCSQAPIDRSWRIMVTFGSKARAVGLAYMPQWTDQFAGNTPHVRIGATDLRCTAFTLHEWFT